MKSRKRTITVSTRIDARTLSVLVNNLPHDEPTTVSNCVRFYLETIADRVIELGAEVPETIEEAIENLHRKGIELKQLDSTNINARRTINAINKEKMKQQLFGEQAKGEEIRQEVKKALEAMNLVVAPTTESDSDSDS